MLTVERHARPGASRQPSRRRAHARAIRAPVSCIRPGELLCLVSAEPGDAAALADRLGGFGDEDGVMLGDVPLRRPTRRGRPPTHRRQRGRSGPLRRHAAERARSVGTRDRSDDKMLDAIAVANAEDIVDALPDGLDAEVEERGRSFSGGQRQRLVLARALLADAEVARARRADERRRRAHRGADRPSPSRCARRPDDRRSSRPARSCSIAPTGSPWSQDGRVVARGNPSRAAALERRLPQRRHTG